MKKMGSMILAAMLLFCGSVQAALVTDNFDRGDTAYSTNNYIGPGWTTSLAADRTAIKSNTLAFDVAPSLSADHLTYNTGVGMIAGTSTDSNSWTMSSDIKIASDGMWAGVAFNVQDADNFYALRIKTGTTIYQMIRVLNGTAASAFVSKSDLSIPFASGTAYTFTISSDTANEFTFTITEAGSSTVLNPQTFTSQGSGNFDGGYGGFYHWTGLVSQQPDATYDNFSVEALPSSSVTTNYYAEWLELYPTLGSSTNYTDDPDFDNMENLLEYALGGIPTNSDAASVLPISGMMEDGGTNWMYYTYNRRLDATARQLAYEVVSGTDLTGAMITATEETGSAAINADFKSVTNRISTEVDAQSFMKLNVEISE